MLYTWWREMQLSCKISECYIARPWSLNWPLQLFKSPFLQSSPQLFVNDELILRNDYINRKKLDACWKKYCAYEICFRFRVLKFTLSNTRFQSFRKRTILQAFKVEHFDSQKWSGEWVELIQKYRAVTSLCQTFVCITKVSCRRGVFTWEKCRATQKWATPRKERLKRKKMKMSR